jgi:Tol biopolymer transport system component
MSYQRLFKMLLGSFMLLLIVVPVLAAPVFTAWGPALSLESLAGTSSELNTQYLEGCPILSRDGKQLFIASDRPGGMGGLDIWVAERASSGDGFSAPVNMGAPINSESNDFCPSPLRDGHGFMFVSNRAGGCGGSDIYLTRRHPEDGWQAPENLGCQVNSAVDEAGPVVSFAEPGSPTLYFSSARSGGPGGMNLYMSRMAGSWSFLPAELVPGVNSDADDMQPYVHQDGRELVFASNRSGGQGSFDIWSASRDTIVGSWSTPVNLGPNVNSPAGETRPSLSWDGRMLLFGSNRSGVEGVSDIFYSTRAATIQVAASSIEELWLPVLNQ